MNKRAAIAIVAASILFTSRSAAAEKKAYAQPQAAVDDFVAALRDDDLEKLVGIFGEDSRRLFASEDPVADENQRTDFLALYDKSHEITSRGESTKILTVGSDPWPLPIPLVRSGAGWTFDTKEGIDEIINRRVGRNELSAIQTCLAVGDAQREYFQADRDGDDVLEYAQTFRSSEGNQNGLYWHTGEGEPLSPIGQFVADAAEEGYGPKDSTFHGYRYRLLPGQGPAAPGGTFDYAVDDNQIAGFAVVAYPADYGDSGVMTFVLSHDGIVYQKDLGEDTDVEARNMQSFSPKGWKKVDEKDRAIIPEP
jgi:hypothetical protein